MMCFLLQLFQDVEGFNLGIPDAQISSMLAQWGWHLLGKEEQLMGPKDFVKHAVAYWLKQGHSI